MSSSSALTPSRSEVLELIETGHAGCRMSVQCGAQFDAGMAAVMTRLIVNEADLSGLGVALTRVATAVRNEI